MQLMLGRVEWKLNMKGPGAPFVMMSGHLKTQLWFASRWDSWKRFIRQGPKACLKWLHEESVYRAIWIRACLHGRRVPRLIELPGYPSYPGKANFSDTFPFRNASKRLHARQGSPPTRGTLSARGTRLGGVAFHHGSAIPANRGEINRENMAAWGEFFRSHHLPVLSAVQNDSQSEEINVIDESQAENRSVPVQEAEIRWKKRFLGRPLCLFVVLSSHSKDSPRSPLTVPVRWVACKGGLCSNPSSRVARLAGAPSLHVTRPLGGLQESVQLDGFLRKGLQSMGL